MLLETGMASSRDSLPVHNPREVETRPAVLLLIPFSAASSQLLVSIVSVSVMLQVSIGLCLCTNIEIHLRA